MERIKRQNIPDFSHKKNIKKLILRIFFYFFLLVMAAATVYAFIFSGLTRITRIKLTGAEEISPEKMEKKAEGLLAGKFLGFIPKNNYIFVRKDAFQKALAEEFKKIEEISVDKEFPDQLNIRIKERQSLIIWCSGGPCYVIDENGYAYASIDLQSKEARENNLIKIIDGSARPVAAGEQVIDSNHLDYVVDLRDILGKEAGISIGEELFTPSRVAEEIQVKTAAGWDIYLSSSFPAENPVEMMKIFLEQKMPPEDRVNLEYIDLRVEGKVYYKMKNMPPQEEPQEENSDEVPEPKKDDKKDKDKN